MNSRAQNNNSTSRSGGRRGNTRAPISSNDQIQQRHNQQQFVPNLSPRDQADLDAFRIALKDLSFNSRPIIEKLTLMARERARSIPGPVSRSILDNLVFVRERERATIAIIIFLTYSFFFIL